MHDFIRLRKLVMAFLWNSWGYGVGDMLTLMTHLFINFTSTFNCYDLIHWLLWSHIHFFLIILFGSSYLPSTEVSREMDHSCFQMSVTTISLFLHRMSFWGLACPSSPSQDTPAYYYRETIDGPGFWMVRWYTSGGPKGNHSTFSFSVESELPTWASLGISL